MFRWIPIGQLFRLDKQPAVDSLDEQLSKLLRQLNEKFTLIQSDYAGIEFEDNTGTTTITVQDVYVLIDIFDENGDDLISTADQANARIVIGATREYLVGFQVTGEVNVGGADLEVEVFEVSSSGTTITGITQADPGVVTATAHGLSDGDKVKISGVSGMTEVNDQIYVVANKAANTFELTDSEGVDVDTSGYTAYTSGGLASAAVGAVEVYNKFPNGSTQSVSASYLHAGTMGNYIELYVKNMDNANDVVFTQAHMFIIGV